jgi:hypothetical protein
VFRRWLNVKLNVDAPLSKKLMIKDWAVWPKRERDQKDEKPQLENAAQLGAETRH